ncbi:hypothetical protein TeGR_g8385 [Tetraparma gracilis]|uniref:Tubby C-terminal domain-containing protein n=1 Tax=Tetraparma gracilis TaxID=2962635 RepID=A0ABQ6N587_9STRA|nr:hypothetical protein TeGR_g8385 [Tetraparma gracilis]
MTGLDLGSTSPVEAKSGLVDAAKVSDGKNKGKVTDPLSARRYASNVLGSRGPRKMQVCINKVDPQEGIHLWQPRSKDAEMLNMFKNKDE